MIDVLGVWDLAGCVEFDGRWCCLDAESGYRVGSQMFTVIDNVKDVRSWRENTKRRLLVIRDTTLPASQG